MSFTWKAPKRLRTPGEVARVCLEVAKARGLDEFAAVLAVMCIAQESDFWCPANENDDSSKNYDHDSLSDDGRSVGYLQQQNGRAGDTLPPGDRDDWWGPMASRMDLRRAVDEFYDRLAGDYRNAVASPLGAAQFIQRVQRSYWNGRTDHPGYYGKHWDRAWALVRGLSATPTPVDTVTPIVTAPPAPTAPVTAKLTDPVTKELWTSRPNAYRPRGVPSPMWIACHTSESASRAVNLRNFCENNKVSYNRIVDDVDIVGMVRDSDAPWAASNANKYAYHICWSSSFASWSRNQWLDPNDGDGFDERNALRLGAKQIAFWIQQSREAGRPIPVEWIGGRNRPPWGLNGICGHVDFGRWGGGHTDPGMNFPVDVMLADVRYFLSGVEQPPVVVPPPVTVPGTNPDKYADWMLYQGNPNNDPERVRRVQTRLKRAYAAYAGHIGVDGDFGPETKFALREFQDRAGLVVDGIVGPMTAAALKP